MAVRKSDLPEIDPDLVNEAVVGLLVGWWEAHLDAALRNNARKVSWDTLPVYRPPVTRAEMKEARRRIEELYRAAGWDVTTEYEGADRTPHWRFA